MISTTTSPTETFDKEHSTPQYGAIYHRDRDTGGERLYFYDGASRECDPFNCSLIGPPTDPIDRMRMIAWYHRLRHTRYAAEVEKLKSSVREHIQGQLENGHCHPPDHRLLDEIEKLTPLRDAAKIDADRAEMALNGLNPKTNLDSVSHELSRRRKLEALLADVNSR